MKDLVRCPQCRLDRSIDMFYQRGSGQPRAQRRLDLCYTCRISNQSWYKWVNGWDWASALVKSTIMRLNHRRNWRYDLGEWLGNIDRRTLVALLSLQGGRCALSDLTLRIPTDMRVNQTFKSWAKEHKLSNIEQKQLPVLVRASTSMAWEPGNVLLVAGFMYDMLEQASFAVSTVVAWLQRTPTVTIPTARALELQSVELYKTFHTLYEQEQHRRDEETHNAETVH